MNDNNQWDPIIVQNMLTYYRNKCYKLEYELLLYKEVSEKRIKELSLVIQSFDDRGTDTSSNNGKRRRKKTDGRND